MSDEHRLGSRDVDYEHLFLDAWGIDEPVNTPTFEAAPEAGAILGDRVLGGHDAGYEHLFESAWAAEDAGATEGLGRIEAARMNEEANLDRFGQ